MRAKKSVWHTRLGHSLFKVVEPVFSKDEITITRGEILKEESNRIKIVKTLVWGYPEGGRGSNVKSVLENLEVLRDKLGPSTWSKLLYFFEISINSHRRQIFDKRVEQSLNASQFRDFNKKEGKWNQKKVDDFFKYIEKLDEVSRDLRVAPEQLENFLFYYNLYFKL